MFTGADIRTNAPPTGVQNWRPLTKDGNDKPAKPFSGLGRAVHTKLQQRLQFVTVVLTNLGLSQFGQRTQAGSGGSRGRLAAVIENGMLMHCCGCV